VAARDEIRAQIQRHLITGDNRLKQGASLEKARQSYERALELAQQAGLEDAVRPLVEIRLADLDRAEARRTSPDDSAA
jgi:predicted negative regulator of RcsB-dependent stress response